MRVLCRHGQHHLEALLAVLLSPCVRHMVVVVRGRVVVPCPGLGDKLTEHIAS